MSETEIEDKEQAVVESELIEPEALETETIQPVIQKKGSFLSFLAFVFSLAALGLSAYMYYLQYNTDKLRNNDNPWQQPLSQLQSQLKTHSDKVQGLTSQMSNIKTDQQNLSEQLDAFKNSNTTEHTPTQSYDDSSLTESINNLQSQLTEQRTLLKQQNQTLTQLKQSYEQNTSQQATVNENAIDPLRKQKIITQDLISSYLLAAHKNLNISGNINAATKSIDMAVKKLSELSDNKYQPLIAELTGLSSKLNATKKEDIYHLNVNIDDAENSLKNLTFMTAQANTKASTSWYDNLVKIKKIDDSDQQLLTQREQEDVRQSIKLHFDLLRSALISQNSTLWNTEIDTISHQIEQYFSESQDSLKDATLNQLNELKGKNINPSFPDLSMYVQKFNALLNANAAGE